MGKSLFPKPSYTVMATDNWFIKKARASKTSPWYTVGVRKSPKAARDLGRLHKKSLSEADGLRVVILETKVSDRSLS